MTLQQLPKIELHLHLDCGLSFEVVSKIDSSITRERWLDEFVAPAKCHDLSDFLTRAVKGYKLMQTREQIQWVIHDLFNQLSANNVIYAEIRFAPLQHLEKGLEPTEVVAIATGGLEAAIELTGIEARLILCTLRHYSEAQSMQTVRLVEQFIGGKVAGFDIAADEAGYPIDNHVSAFRYAKEKGIPCTAHAGEACGPESVWETLEFFEPSRIGHGVRSIEDPELVEYLKRKQVHLEICPACNIQVDLYPNYQDHPIDKLYRQGVSLSVNTDAPTIVNTTLTKEYESLQSVFGWTAADLYHCNHNAIEAAFITDSLKDALKEKIKQAYKMP